MNLIITTEERLSEMIKSTFLSLIPNQKEKEQEKAQEKFSIEESIGFLDKHGYYTSKSTLYKATHNKTISYKKFGNKIVFDGSELLKWAESKVSTKNSTKEATLRLAVSALRKK